ncbi:unannotated protein [freshwater metagenome]|uniref:Unannotated protein n=1 Tax=freshwater metagenome TaxID=449393 RepID=A0A6J6GGK5_9ZZZZ
MPSLAATASGSTRPARNTADRNRTSFARPANTFATHRSTGCRHRPTAPLSGSSIRTSRSSQPAGRLAVHGDTPSAKMPYFAAKWLASPSRPSKRSAFNSSSSSNGTMSASADIVASSGSNSSRNDARIDWLPMTTTVSSPSIAAAARMIRCKPSRFTAPPSRAATSHAEPLRPSRRHRSTWRTATSSTTRHRLHRSTTTRGPSRPADRQGDAATPRHTTQSDHSTTSRAPPAGDDRTRAPARDPPRTSPPPSDATRSSSRPSDRPAEPDVEPHPPSQNPPPRSAPTSRYSDSGDRSRTSTTPAAECPSTRSTPSATDHADHETPAPPQQHPHHDYIASDMGRFMPPEPKVHPPGATKNHPPRGRGQWLIPATTASLPGQTSTPRTSDPRGGVLTGHLGRLSPASGMGPL